MMQQINIKPVGINEQYTEVIRYVITNGKRVPIIKRILTKKGREFKEKSCYFIKKCYLPESNSIKIILHFGFSNRRQDVDGPIKSCIDILQHQMNFNDNIVTELEVKKFIVAKGNEYWSYELINLEV